MADLKSIVCIDQAQNAPTTIPDDALVLIEIDRQVYKTTYGELAAGGGAVPDGAVTTAKLVDGAVTTAKLADGAVTAVKLGSNAVTDAKVASNAAIALSKLANVAAGTGGLAAGTVQATFQALATRIAALEAAAP